MKINEQNINEKWTIFLSGNMTKDEENDLMIFLESRADLLDQLTESADEMSFNKNKLSPDELTEYLLIEKIEGCLSLEEESKLDQQISADADLQKTYFLYQQTRLQPNEKIVFPNKHKLKKGGLTWIFPLTATAAILAFIIMFNLFDKAKNVQMELPDYQQITAINELPVTDEETKQDNFPLQENSRNEGNDYIEKQRAESLKQTISSKPNASIEIAEEQNIQTANAIRMEIAQIKEIEVPAYNYEMTFIVEEVILAENESTHDDGIIVVKDTKFRQFMRKTFNNWKNNLEESEISNRITELKDELTLAYINNR